MPASFNGLPLIGGSYRLDDDLCVRLRMARSSDIVPIRRLMEQQPGAGALELASLVQFDPRRRCVICATALIDSTETLVGVGSIALDGPGGAAPDILLVAEDHAEALFELLTEALRLRAAQVAESRAA